MDAINAASEAVVRGQFLVARKALDVVQEQGDAAVELIRAAKDAGNPSNGSVSPSPEASSSGRLDISA